MPGRECYHCKQWIEEGQAHDCWTTTEAALTGDLPEDLQEAWARLRETAAAFGEQRIYASLNSIMFSRKSCYFFVRPKRRYLEVCIFLGRTVAAPQIRRVEPASKVKMAHLVHVRHRDEVEPPLTDWLHEAYQLQDRLTGPGPAAASTTAAPSAAATATPRDAPPKRARRGEPPAKAAAARSAKKTVRGPAPTAAVKRTTAARPSARRR